MDKVLFIYTMSRSGHHAIINWIQCQFKGKSIHYNHCFKGWGSKKLIPMHGAGGAREIVMPGKGSLKIYSIEDLDPFDYQKHDFDSFPELRDSEVTYMWIIRDPYNWLASSLSKNGPGAKPDKHMTNELGYTGTRIELYMKQIQEFKGETTHIPHEIMDVSYNDWVISKLYRRDLAKTLDLPFTDAGLNEVSKFGGGSTFDGMGFQGRAQQMKVINRWETWSDSQRFLDCLTPELIEFSEDYFKFRPIK